MKTGGGTYLTHVLEALSLIGVTPPGRITFAIICWGSGMFNIRGLTIGPIQPCRVGFNSTWKTLLTG
jgi:hypothetical protein